MRLWLFLAAVNGLMAVIAGAFGWHWLDAASGTREIFAVGVDYQMWHALALLAVAWLASRTQARDPAVTVAGWSFTAGIVLFSGTLYAFGFLEYIPLEGAAPAGGGLLMLGWAALIWAAVRRV